jgi:hypothetical protein
MASAASSTPSAPGAGLRGAAWLAFALLVVVVFGAAFIRFAQGDASLEGAVDAARWSYRVAAIVFVLAIAGIAVLGWDALQPASRVVLGAQVALAIALTFLGRITPSSDHPIVAFGNPLGGLALIGLAWWIVLAASPATGTTRPLTGGGLIAAAFAALAVIVVRPVGIAAGLAVQLAAAAVLVAGVTLVYRRSD